MPDSADPTPETQAAAPRPEDAPKPETLVVFTAKRGLLGLSIVLGLLAAGLLIGVLGLRSTVKARETTIMMNQNRSDQIVAGSVELTATLEGSQAETVRVRQLLNEANKEGALLKAESLKIKAASVDTQRLLERAQTASTGFQSDMAAAKVASLQQQGLAEVARTDANVMQAKMKQAEADANQAREKLAESTTLVAALQAKLTTADAEIVRLRALPAKR